MRFGVLGPLLVEDAGTRVAIESPQLRMLLVRLLADANGIVSVTDLQRALWGDEPPPSARGSLYNQVLRLRRQLGPEIGARIRTAAPGYLIEVRDGELDEQVFLGQWAQGRAALQAQDWAVASRHLQTALGLWRGEPGSDLPSAGAEAIHRLTEIRLLALAGRFEAGLRLSGHRELVAEIRASIEEYPLHEVFHGQLMLALYRSGRQAEALDAFRRLQRTLLDELGVEPDAALQRLHQRILTADPGLAEPDRAPDPAAEGGSRDAGATPEQDRAGSRRQLPADTRVFVGRTRQVGELIASAHPGPAGAAVVVISGLAGIGKSALATHVAHRIRDRFPYGQLFLDLHGHTTGLAPLSAGDALHWLLRCLGVPVQLIPEDLGQRAALYRDRLAGTRTLLILDNAISAAQVRPLLPSAAGCVVLVTSRKRLAGLDDAQFIALDSLSEADAVTLLRDIAGRGRIPAAQPAAGELAALCGRVPLALRIAAARLRHQPALRIEDLVERLRDENTRLDHLQDGDRNLAAVFDSSYQALPEAERHLLRGLGLIPGPDFDAYAVANLTRTGLATAQRRLDSLTEHNLLIEHTAGRYRFHDLVRVYARSLGAAFPADERGAALVRLLDYYQHLARVCDLHLTRRTRPGPARDAAGLTAAPDIRDRATALTWLRTERAGLLAAVAASAEHGDKARVVSLTAVLSDYLDQDGSWREAAALHRAAASAAHELQDRSGEADALLSLSRAYEAAGDYPSAAAQCELALAIYTELGDVLGEANAVHTHGRVLLMSNDLPAAAARQERALSLYRTLGDSPGEANALCQLGRLAMFTSDAAASADLASMALSIYRRLGDRLGEADTRWDLARARQLAGDTSDGPDLVAGALTIYQELGYRSGEAKALCALARFSDEAGDHAGAAGLIERALAIYREIGSPLGEAAACRELAKARLMTGDLDRASGLLEHALELFRAIGGRLGQADSLHDLGRTRLAQADYPAAAGLLREALDLFRELGVSLGEAEVLVSTGALLAQTTGAEAAADVYRRAASLAREIDARPLAAEALEGVARCQAASGDVPAAIAGLREVVAIYRQTGSARADEARALLDELHERDPHPAHPRQGSGRLAVEPGQRDRRRGRLLRLVCDLDPVHRLDAQEAVPLGGPDQPREAGPAPALVAVKVRDQFGVRQRAQLGQPKANRALDVATDRERDAVGHRLPIVRLPKARSWRSPRGMAPGATSERCANAAVRTFGVYLSSATHRTARRANEMDETRNQLSSIDFTALTGRLVELEAARKVAQWTQTDEWEEDGELERLIDLRDQLVRISAAETAGSDDPALPGGTHFRAYPRLSEDERTELGRLRRENAELAVRCDMLERSVAS